MKALLSGILPSKIDTQYGMALLLCLLFLTALALLGLSASAETVMQDMLASNLQETERAKQSALAAQHWAENWLLQLDGPAPSHCSVPCSSLKIHAPGSLPAHPEFENLSWWIEQGHKAGVNPLTGEWMASISTGSIDPPIWVVEAVHEVPPPENGTADLQTWYRVLTRGCGRTKAGVSVVESIIVRSWASIGGVDGTGTGATQPCPGTDPATKCGRIAWRELL